MVKVLQVGDTLELPAEDFIEAATALIGKRKRGKSGLERVIAEELIKAGLPFVWLDFVGIAWGLRSSADGKSPGLSVVVVGGEHGDLDLDARAGGEVARMVIEANCSLVIDLSKSSKGDWRRFVTEFCDTLYQENDSPRLVILDEASEFVPQNLRVGGPERAKCFEAVERLVSRGRNQGIGVIVADQRPARINKDVLTQVDYLICFGVSHPIDLKALKEWVELQADPAMLKHFEAGLAGLQPREAWVWNPEMGIFSKFRVRDFTTLHPDKTHLRRQGLLRSKPVTSDVSAVVEQLRSAMKAAGHEEEPGDHQDDDGTVEAVQKLREGLAAEEQEARRLASELHRAEQRNVVLQGILEQMCKRTADELAFLNANMAPAAAGGLAGEHELAPVGGSDLVSSRAPESPVSQVEDMPRPSAARHNADGPRLSRSIIGLAGKPIAGSLDRCEAAIVAVLTQHPEGCDRGKLTLLAGYRWSGGFRNALSRLRTAGLLEGGNSDVMCLTKAGRAVSGRVPPLPRGRALIDYWLNHPSLGKCERTVLSVLVKHAPSALTAKELCEFSGYEWSGGFRNALSRLRTAGLLEGSNRGKMRASQILVGGPVGTRRGTP